ncbi:unnamed protein product [Rhizoctonia solani]|uniref:F-box domain-containing protein n=1 Tax=Rhizoctonia solani TaxID=456999 RepID=A0A8H3HI39_9AGAM|nr:unnamed protein product [Rhizoctonia solani]CAE6518266.1 unnamed protein product [Rhizoctonia solani]
MTSNDVDCRLPTETLYRIFHLVHPSGLTAICLVSHWTKAIVEPILYASPQANSPARVLLLVQTLLARSDLAQCVKSLLLSMDGSDAEDGLGTRYLPSLLRRVKFLFEGGTLENLIELAWCARGETGWALPDSDNSLPRLTRFSTTAASPSLVPFLTTHPSISRLTLHSHGLALRLPADALPCLTHLACAASALSSLPVRKLKHVIFLDAPFIPLLGDGVLSALATDRNHPEFGRGWRDASPAPDHVESLRSITLRLGHVIISPVQAPLILEPFARHVSALKKLGIVAGPSFFTPAVLGSLTPALEGFTELETIHMECSAESDSTILVGALSGGCTSPEGGCSPHGTGTPLEGIPATVGGYSPLGETTCPPSAEETRLIIQAWKGACPSIENVRLPWWSSGRA